MRYLNTDNSTDTADRVPLRSERATADTWNLEALYPDNATWEEDFASIPGLVDSMKALRGTLHMPEQVRAFLDLDTELDRLMDRLYAFAHMRADENTADTANQARENRIRTRYADVGAELSWARPELLRNPEATIRQWSEHPLLEPYRYALIRLARQKPHTLSAAEEKIFSGAGTVFAAPGEIYTLLTNADLTFPSVKDENGRDKELSQGRFLSFMVSRDRTVRRAAFESFYDTYGSIQNTTAATLRNHVRMHNFTAKTRAFPSALAAALHPDDVPVSLYDALIEAVHQALPSFHRYVELRRRCLDLDAVNMYDLYVPIVPDVDLDVPFEQAKDWILAACAPLGQEYVEVLKTAFTERWIDRYENRGKRSGAYSGGCYDSLPYILMNYQRKLDDVFTLAHELGHSMHSYLANANQPPQTAQYPIFIAEIASTANEALLLHFLLREHAGNKPLNAYLLNHYCDGFRGTVYRQTMFAEFEKTIHEMDAENQPLTPDTLSETYVEINRTYHGDAVDADRRIRLEWSRIPHFYYNFYVYKYATSFCASQVLAAALLENSAAQHRFLELLRAGGSDDPLTLVSRAGVDLTKPRAFEKAFERFETTTHDLENMLAGHSLRSRNAGR